MRSWVQWLLLAGILLLAGALRWTGLDWDEYRHYHPDERYITWVATSIEWPSSWRGALDPQRSSFNPFYWPPGAASEGIEVNQDVRRKFAYGHVPLYMGVTATRLVEATGPALQGLFPQGWLFTRDILNAREAIEFRHLTAVTRALTALVDLLLILVLFLTGRRLYSPEVGLLAAAFLAVNVMHIQLAHFFAFDPYLALFVALALYFMIRAATAPGQGAVQDDQRPHQRSLQKLLTCQSATCNLLVASVFIGLAVGSKFTAVMLFLPLAAAVWLGEGRRRWLLLPAAGLLAFVTFFLTNPFAILDFGCQAITPALRLGPITVPALDWRSCYLENIFTQGAMVRGEIDLGFTRQYTGTLPYLYPIEMQLRWGMGWALGVAAFAGFAWAIWQGARYARERFRARSRLEEGASARQRDARLVLLAWTLPFFLVTASFYVKFMRYLLPITPFLMLYGAALLWGIRRPALRYLAAAVVLVLTMAYAFSFVNIYSTPHPWSNASRWVYRHVPPGTLMASEQWDDALPMTLPVDGELRLRREYRDEQLTWLTGPDEADDAAKLARNLDLLERAEYVTVLSNRVYGVVPRLPARFPISSQYYPLLFDGSLGYEPVYVSGRAPHLFGLFLRPDSFGWPGLQPPELVADFLAGQPGINGGRFDESFTVYDQPLTMIFQNVEHKTAEEMRQYFVVE